MWRSVSTLWEGVTAVKEYGLKKGGKVGSCWHGASDGIGSPQFGYALAHAATRASVETESIDSTQVSGVISS